MRVVSGAEEPAASAPPTPCETPVAFTAPEFALLAALPKSTEALDIRTWCELEHGHSGLHYGLGQISDSTWWWLRWNDEQDRREFVDAGFCGAQPENGHGDCSLPFRHEGGHSYILGTTE